MYRQKNTVSNLENVGFSIEGHEGMYNIFMMEETQTIFAVGAGAVTKLVKRNPDNRDETIITRIVNHKYPYEYLRAYENKKSGIDEKNTKEQIFKFFET